MALKISYGVLRNYDGLPYDLKGSDLDILGIESLWNNKAYRQKLAKGALERAQKFSWDKKVEVLNTIYQEAKR